MAFIGNTSTTQSFTPAIDYFSGNGSTTAFTLTRPVASVAQVQVVVNNVAQNPSSAYSVSGNTITFTSAPSSGTSNIYVYYTSPITQVIQPSQGTVGKTQLDVYGGSGTGAMTIPSGTTAQRPSAPLVGDTQWNSTLAQMEVYIGYGVWQAVVSSSYSVNYLVIAGGGGGGFGSGGGGGGGGAGGYRSSFNFETSGGGSSAESALTVQAGTAYTVTIGAGGAGATSSGYATLGGNSVFSSITSVGGGYGAAYNGGSVNGASGGSGGGAGNATPAGSGGSGTSGQGYAGGGSSSSASGYNGGGGGGAGAVGTTGTSSVAGVGGVGVSSSINGSATFRAGGGGAGSGFTNANGGGAGGSGGGGAGGNSSSSNGTAGTANTGGGGGGTNSQVGGAGGSGVVIVSYAGTSARATGGTITITGGYVIHTFTSSGTFTA
jgi:hypothetical protein